MGINLVGSFCLIYDFQYLRLSEMGQHVGARILEVLVVRERSYKREIKLLNILLFIKSNVWKVSCLANVNSILV